jgi:dihydrofolate reductase
MSKIQEDCRSSACYAGFEEAFYVLRDADPERLLRRIEEELMQRVIAGASISLDGYSTGPNVGSDNPMGDGGSRLHEWIFQPDEDREVVEFSSEGAVIVGKRMFDLGEKPWGDNPPFHLPVFVLTHTPREALVKEGGTTFTFVSDGIESALKQARAAAGDKDVAIGGGASTVQQYLRAGLLDELQLHVLPVIFGGGTRFFEATNGKPIELERLKVTVSRRVTHLWFRVINQ